MTNKNRKLVAVDLDNTFLRDDQTISDESVKFVRKFVHDGNIFVIATGRPFQGAEAFYKRIGVNTPMIATNGGAIFYYENDLQTIKEFEDFSMDKDIFLTLFREVKDFLYTYQVRTPFSYHFKDYSKIPFFILHEDPRVSMHENDIEESLKENPIDADFCVLVDKKDEFEAALKNYPQFKHIYRGTIDGVVFYEVSSINASKGLALEYLRKKYNILKDNVYAFGDQLNDVSLFEYANGVAMINAQDEVKMVAKFVTEKTNNEDGVIEFLKNIH